MFGEGTFVYGEDTFVFGQNTFVHGEDNLGRSWASASPIARALYQLQGPKTYGGGRHSIFFSPTLFFLPQIPKG